MIIPIRCFTCGNVIASKYLEYNKRVRRKRYEKNTDQPVVLTKSNIHQVNSTPEKEVLDDMGIKRYCCRRHFISHVDIARYL